MRRHTPALVAVLAALAAGLSVLNLPARAGEGPALPNTPAGKQAAAWLHAYNSGETEVVRRFIAEHYANTGKITPARRLEAISQVYGDNGRLELVRVEKSSDYEVVAVVRSPASGSWLRISFTVEADAPHRITKEGVQFTESPPAGGQKKLTDAEIVHELEAYVDELAAADRFSGSVLFAKDGKPLFEKAYGLASKAFGVPNRVDTKFNLGSMNKMFTAVCIARLAQDGKLDFSDTLIKHLPDYPNQEAARKITLHQLLTHTSGLGDFFNEEYRKTPKDRFRTVRDYFPLFADKPLVLEPGKEFRYSNAGFIVLGAVIEKVSGQSYFDYVREHVYRPAGMTDTDAYEMDHDTPNLAIGYTREAGRSGKLAGGYKNNLFLHVVKGGPAGGGFSTVQDLLRFDVALRSHRLLDAKHTDLVLTGKVRARKDSEYAYGFSTETRGGTRIVGHGGGFPGINSALEMYLDKGYTVAVMSNYDPPAAQRVAGKLQQLITRE